jgi:cell division septation protein DedD
MDRQKIFWVVLSVSVFVVVVLVVGVLLLRQKPVTEAAAPGTVSPISDPGTQLYEYSRPATPGDGTETMHFVIGDSGEPGPGPVSTDAGTTLPAVKSDPVSAVPERVTAPAATTAPVRKPQTTRAPAAAAATRAGPDYWIQTGSYKSQTRAEELATLLEGKGLAGRVFTYTSGAATYFRVRVGPFAHKGEAEKFLANVRQIQGLESSYISMVAAARKVN